MRSLLRAILAVTLLLGSGIADWAPATAAQPHECCCGMVPTGVEDSCPCPKPEGNRAPQRSTCFERQSVVAAQAARRTEQGQRRKESRPAPADWVGTQGTSLTKAGFAQQPRGRDPDLGRHLARLDTLRI